MSAGDGQSDRHGSEMPEGIPLHYDNCPYTDELAMREAADCTCGYEHLASVWKARWMVADLDRQRLTAERDAALDPPAGGGLAAPIVRHIIITWLGAAYDGAGRYEGNPDYYQDDQVDALVDALVGRAPDGGAGEGSPNILGFPVATTEDIRLDAIALVEQYRDDPHAPIPWDSCGEAILARLQQQGRG